MSCSRAMRPQPRWATRTRELARLAPRSRDGRTKGATPAAAAKPRNRRRESPERTDEALMGWGGGTLPGTRRGRKGFGCPLARQESFEFADQGLQIVLGHFPYLPKI